jgi:hypothetical protein
MPRRGEDRSYVRDELLGGGRQPAFARPEQGQLERRAGISSGTETNTSANGDCIERASSA